MNGGPALARASWSHPTRLTFRATQQPADDRDGSLWLCACERWFPFPPATVCNTCNSATHFQALHGNLGALHGAKCLALNVFARRSSSQVGQYRGGEVLHFSVCLVVTAFLWRAFLPCRRIAFGSTCQRANPTADRPGGEREQEQRGLFALLSEGRRFSLRSRGCHGQLVCPCWHGQAARGVRPKEPSAGAVPRSGALYHGHFRKMATARTPHAPS